MGGKGKAKQTEALPEILEWSEWYYDELTGYPFRRRCDRAGAWEEQPMPYEEYQQRFEESNPDTPRKGFEGSFDDLDSAFGNVKLQDDPEAHHEDDGQILYETIDDNHYAPFDHNDAAGPSNSRPSIEQSAKASKNTKIPKKLTEGYRRLSKDKQKSFFQVGTVFKMVHSEPLGNEKPRKGVRREDDEHISVVSYGEKVYSGIRRFVVVKEKRGHSICAPIQTYSRQATLKPGLPNPLEHAMIYSGDQEPPPHQMMVPSRKNPDVGVWRTEQLILRSFKMRRSNMRSHETDLGLLSRINFGRKHSVDHTVCHLWVGRIVDEDIPMLEIYSTEYA